MEAKLKAALGEMNFLILALQTQLEAANKKIAELEREAKPNGLDATVSADVQGEVRRGKLRPASQ